MKRIKRILTATLRCLYWFPFRIIVQHLPYKAGLLLVYPAVLLGYILNKKRRKLTEDGLNKMFDGRITKRQQMLLVLKTFHSYYKRGIDVFWYPKLTKGLSKKIVVCEGLEYLDAAILEGKGVVLLHGHLGNAHMLMPAIGFRGYALSQLGSRNPPKKVIGLFSGVINKIEKKIYELKLSYKEALPVNFIYTDKFLRDPIRRLKNNEIIAMALDGREGSKWIDVKFLKHNALFSIGIMKLINKIKPVVLPTFVVRQDNNTHKVIITKPMELKITDDKEYDILENTTAFLSLFEKYIYEYPYLYGDTFWLGNAFFLDGG
jgi:lauroyl/myristoyl acyltransferase